MITNIPKLSAKHFSYADFFYTRISHQHCQTIKARYEITIDKIANSKCEFSKASASTKLLLLVIVYKRECRRIFRIVLCRQLINRGNISVEVNIEVYYKIVANSLCNVANSLCNAANSPDVRNMSILPLFNQGLLNKK